MVHIIPLKLSFLNMSTFIQLFLPSFKNIILCRIGLKIQILETAIFKPSKKSLPRAPRSQSAEVCVEICITFIGNKAKSKSTGGNGLCEIQVLAQKDKFLSRLSKTDSWNLTAVFQFFSLC